MIPDVEQLKQHAIDLKLYGLQAHWHELTESQFPGLASLLEWALTERQQRGLERRLRNARIGRFKTLADFDWRWPEHIEQCILNASLKISQNCCRYWSDRRPLYIPRVARGISVIT